MENNKMKQEIAYQPMLDVVPCVGWKVEMITPDEKYQDFGKEPIHYSMNRSSLENSLTVVKSFKDLKGDTVFKQVKKMVTMKDMMPTQEQYLKACHEAAKSMGINDKGLTEEQKLAQKLSDIMSERAFNDKPNATGVKTQSEYYHQMDADVKHSYTSGERLSSITRDMF